MADNAVPSTKKLKSMLKMLTEHGVARYKDGEVEIEFSGFLPAEQLIPQKDFDISNYDGDERAVRAPNGEAVDDLGFTDEDYLYRSADR